MEDGLLFDEDESFGEGGRVIDCTDITTTTLYMSEPELKEFKALCKLGIKQELGQEYQQKGNLTDFLLMILRKNYGGNKDDNSQTHTDGSAGRSA